MAAQMRYVESSIQFKLDCLPEFSSNFCIYKVPEHLRQIKRECYQPSIVSIGPIYYGKSYLQNAQELKLMHVQCFLKLCHHANSLGQFIEKMIELEQEARSYYEEKTSLSSNEFVEMMMIDAAFIIYLCLSCTRRESHLYRLETPLVKKKSWMLEVLQDVFVEDNQLPFFVLEKLYDIAFSPVYPGNMTFKDLTLNTVGELGILGSDAAKTPECKERVTKKQDIKHLVDLLRLCCLPPTCLAVQNRENNDESSFSLSSLLHLIHPQKKQKNRYLPPTAEQLRAFGVKFEADESKNLLNITFSANGVLKIPTLLIDDTTETILRNLVFFELCHPSSEYNHLIDYVCFLDMLMNTPEDLQILVKHGVIENSLGSDEEVATMVNRIAKNVIFDLDNFYYYDITQKLNAHASTRWNKWKKILEKDYFNHPWSIISVIYLVVLLILTVLQVYTGFMALPQNSKSS